MEKIGSRVGAMESANKETVRMYGYGVYDGDHVPASGWLHDAKIPNPKIILDDGGVVWGYQCWWGDEEAVLKKVGDREVIMVSAPED